MPKSIAHPTRLVCLRAKSSLYCACPIALRMPDCVGNAQKHCAYPTCLVCLRSKSSLSCACPIALRMPEIKQSGRNGGRSENEQSAPLPPLDFRSGRSEIKRMISRRAQIGKRAECSASLLDFRSDRSEKNSDGGDGDRSENDAVQIGKRLTPQALRMASSARRIFYSRTNVIFQILL